MADGNFGNITATGNIVADGYISAAGNITAARLLFTSPTTANIDAGNLALYSNLNMTGTISASGNVLATGFIGNLVTGNQPNIVSIGTLSSLIVSGNATSGNVLTSGIVSSTGNATHGNVTAGIVSANVMLANTITFNSPTTANIDVGNLALYSNLNMTGAISTSGNITGARFIGNLVTTNQPNITSVGTLTSLSVSGNATAGNVLTPGIVSSAGNATHGNVAAGIVSANDVLTNSITFNSPTTANISVGNLALYSNLNMTGSISAAGNIKGNYFIGNGSQLTGISGGNANTGNVTFDDINIIGTGNLHLQPDPTNSASFLDVFLTSGPDLHLVASNGANLILGEDTGANVLASWNGNVSIQSWNQSTGNLGGIWTFDANGNLTLPANTFSVNYANGDPVTFSGGSGNIGNVTFDDNTVIGTGDEYGGSGLYLAPGANSIGNVQYLRVRGGDFPTHIHLDTGNNQYFDQYFGDDNKYVKLANTGNIVINSNDNTGNSAQWTFGVDSTTTFPNNTILTPINEDFDITVQDEEDDGWSINNTITDGIGNNLSQTSLDSGQFSIYTDLPAGGYEWRFERETLQVTNNSFIRGFDSNVTVQSMFAGSNGTASLQSVSNQNDPNVFSTFDATTSAANIKVYNGGSSGGTEYAWQFSNDGNLTLPSGGNLIVSGAIVGSGASPAPILSGFDSVNAINFSASGNISGNIISASGNITATNFIGNLVSTPTYGSFYDTTTQINSNVGNAIPISYNTVNINNGVTIAGAGNTQITIAETGIYNIQFSLQVTKTDSGADSVYVWLDKNGNSVANSATNLYLVGSNAAEVAAWNFVVSAAANDYYRLMWMSTDSHVEISAVAAGAVVPAIPSVILTVVPVGA